MNCKGFTKRKTPCKNKPKNNEEYCHLHKINNEYKESECCICLEVFTPDFKPLKNCNHYIHIECVYKSGKNICPVCRAPVEFNKKEEKQFQKYKKKLEEEKEREDNEYVRNLFLEEIENYMQNFSFDHLFQTLNPNIQIRQTQGNETRETNEENESEENENEENEENENEENEEEMQIETEYLFPNLSPENFMNFYLPLTLLGSTFFNSSSSSFNSSSFNSSSFNSSSSQPP
jgi:hypothetical protein